MFSLKYIRELSYLNKMQKIHNVKGVPASWKKEENVEKSVNSDIREGLWGMTGLWRDYISEGLWDPWMLTFGEIIRISRTWRETFTKQCSLIWMSNLHRIMAAIKMELKISKWSSKLEKRDTTTLDETDLESQVSCQPTHSALPQTLYCWQKHPLCLGNIIQSHTVF